MTDQANPDPHQDGSSGAPSRTRTRQHGGRRRQAFIAAVAALAAVGVGAGLAACGGGKPAPTKTTQPPPPPTTSAPPAPNNPLTGQGPEGHVLAVKIDNVGQAQFQQAGLNSADLVYAIQVEGGLSRYLVVFDSNHVPPKVGPVRSARQTDIPLLAAFGHVGLAYSGAISGLKPDLARANLQEINPINNPNLFSNGGSAPTFIQPSQIFAAFPNLAKAQDIGLRFGAEPAGGAAASSVTARMPAASFTFTASGNQWLVSADGHPVTTTDAGRANTVNVIIQHVKVVQGKYTDYNAGHADNEVFSQTSGQGSADFYRDGKVWHGQWTKPNDTSQTQYTVGGKEMELAPGRTWIVLEGS
ncbi:DUF3048 domain-containing protein [Streptacidiphilus fuscans]|uniref:DUF3048 domain-containing protein n=1 Tax=Streptacidiphilus fuscans TaxID=2789292 RepID=A0A931FDK7_9ACTN|nr:DUF3048 domain-containing protein [Streptacidiphilus fuscans]MBF9069663.1 DUF3048 domain-containing protein [Streptacidiphilus fuscans]